jgi:hypothetical protein
MEEQVWPSTDDYLMYTGGDSPTRKPMWDIRTSPGGLYHYGGFMWAWFMENYLNSVDVVLEVWVNCAETWGSNMMEAQTDMFEAHGKTFEQAFMDYGYYRWCTDEYWYEGCGLYCEEASEWAPGPLVLPEHNITTLPAYDIEDYVGVAGDTYELECFGIQWIKVNLDDYQDGWVTMDFDGRDNFDWNFATIMYSEAGDSQFQWFDLEAPANEISVAVQAAGWDFVLFVPTFMTETGLDAYYTADVTFSTNAEGGSVTPQQMAIGVSANPLTSAGAVSIDLPAPARADLAVYDMSGRRVATLCNEDLAAGSHSFGLQELNLEAGTYLFNLFSGNGIATTKAVLVP